MRSSSAPKTSQLDFDFSSDLAPPTSSEYGKTVPNLERLATPFPAFAYAVGARRAGRLNASAATDEERLALLSERRVLLDKKFEGGLTKKEENRLHYVRWSLDRIEDARFGSDLDALEAVIAQYEQFSDDVRALKAQVAELEQGKR